ncbi:MAG: dihydrodipicolinate synthase family protein [Oscillospiraceae bacterium]|nr:dihydrodipicolinate synthase family protein [Oscillospiraceae bacterium]
MAVDKKFTGVFPAFYACYDDKGDISRDRASKLAEFYAGVGVKGLYVTGSSGECVFHNVEERKATLEAVMEAVGDKMTIIAHIAAPSTRDSIELARHAENLGVDAIAMVPGFYYGLKVPVVRKYWCDVLEATDNVPLFIYNIPGTTNGFNLPVELLQEMLATGRVAGVKNSSGSVQDILKFRMAGGEDMAIFNGPDEQYVAGRMMGASGGIGGTYGYMPEAFLKLDALVNAGEMEKAAAMQKEITSIIYDTLKIGSLYAAAKGVLQLRGQELGGVRAPFLNLKSGDEVAVRDIHEKIQALLARW